MAHQQHHLQRLSSPSRAVSLVFHLIGIASFGYSFHFLTLWETPLTYAYGWHFQFLTVVGLASALLAFVLAVLADFTLSSVLFEAKNAISVVATPLEVVISILYWGLWAVDPKLLVQEDLELPLFTDISFHLAPALLLSLDLLIFSPPWTISAYNTMALSTVFAFAYWYWVELCFSKNGWYPYPLFGLLSTIQRVFLFVFSAALVTLSSGALKWTYARINGYHQPDLKGKKTQ